MLQDPAPTRPSAPSCPSHRADASGVYAIPKIEFHGRGVVTNTTPVTTFRGAGRPEASQSLERMMDLFAAEIGMDPIEVRRRNFIPKDAFPHKTATGATYDSGDYEGALDLALRAVDYDELRAEQKQRRDAGDTTELGIGISTYTEITNPVARGGVRRGRDHRRRRRHRPHRLLLARAGPRDDVRDDRERAARPSDRADRRGQGRHRRVAQGTGTYGSKSTQIGGAAARGASDDVVEQAKELAADYLEASVDDIELDTGAGAFHVAGLGRAVARLGGARVARGRRRQARAS